jgi:hypothetical protein
MNKGILNFIPVILIIALVSLLFISSCKPEATNSNVENSLPSSPSISITPTNSMTPNQTDTSQDSFDNLLITGEFDRWSPGYSDIKILSRKGDSTSNNPRILTIQTTINSYPKSVVCEGELVFFKSDPSYRQMRWYDLESIGHALLVQWGSQALDPRFPIEAELVELLIKRWVENDLVKLDSIKNKQIYDKVKSWIDNPASMPTYSYRNAGVFDTSKIQTYDLSPDLSTDLKVPIYLLKPDGTVELYLVDKSKRYGDTTINQLSQKGQLLPTPINRQIASK